MKNMKNMKNIPNMISEIFYTLIFDIDMINKEKVKKTIIDDNEYKSLNDDDDTIIVFIKKIYDIKLNYTELIYVLILFEYVIKNYNIKNYMNYIIPAVISLSIKIVSDENLYLKDIANYFNVNFKKLYDIEFILYKNIFLIDDFKITKELFDKYDTGFIEICNMRFKEYNVIKNINKYLNRDKIDKILDRL
jgi:hypothetical protein